MSEPPITILPGDEQLPGMPAEEVTLNCPECGDAFTGAPAGANSAKWKLSTHRWNRHKVRASSPRRTGGKNGKRSATDIPVNPSPDNRPGLAAVADIRAAAGGSRRNAGTPTEADLAGGLGRALQLATVAGASFVVETDPSIPAGEVGDQVREQLVDYLTLDADGARAAVSPIARVLAPTTINKKYGRAIVQNADVVGSISDLGLLIMHWRQVFRARRQPGGLMAYATGVQPAFTPQFIAQPMGETFAPAPAPQDVATPPMQVGHVLSADDIKDLQQRNGSV